MTGKEALRILSECANGEKKLLFSDSLDLERIISKRLEKLEKLERAFEILKDNFFIDLIERQDDWKLGFEPVNPIEGQPRFSQLPKEEAELLEELMKSEETRN